MLQRTYPFKSTPREARRNAFDEAQARGLEATAEADNFSWRTIGPTSSRSAYFDRNRGALSGCSNTIAVSVADAQLILLGGGTGGIWCSSDGGANWHYFSQGLPPIVVTSLTAQVSGLIQAGTYGRGAYELFNKPTKSQEISQ